MGSPRMRWERLFADLEAQWDAEARRDLDAEVADRTRRELARVELVTRVSAQLGSSMTVQLRTGVAFTGALRDLGADWMLLGRDVGEVLVPLSAVVGFIGLRPRTGQARTARRFALGYAVRLLARDRAEVLLTDLTGQRRSGTVDRVGADFLDLAEHPSGELRRQANVQALRTIPFSALVCVESR